MGYSTKTDAELDRVIKAEYPSSDLGFGALAERQHRLIKKPHRPSFFLLIASVILSFLALCIAIIALPQVQQAVFLNPTSFAGKGASPQGLAQIKKQEPSSPKKKHFHFGYRSYIT